MTTRTALGATFLALLSACTGECSCGTTDNDDGTGGADTSTTTAVGTGTGGQDTGTGGDAGTGGDPGTGGNPGTGGDPGTGGAPSTGGFCAPGCEEAIDCCPAGVENCPGDYPLNFECNAGICSSPGCSADDECTFGGALPTYACFQEGDFGACAEACETDDDCTTDGFTCIGEDDDGDTYCSVEPTEPEPCETDDDCFGYGVCQDDGSCQCSGDEECTGAEGLVCVE